MEETGKKRQEGLKWTYSMPATGNGSSTNDLGDYQLGKETVDKILTGDGGDKVSLLPSTHKTVRNSHSKVGASHKSFIAMQFANAARDTAAKILEDPLLATKQQEHAACQAIDV